MAPAMVTAEMTGQDLTEWAISLSEHSYELVVDDLAEEHRALSLAQLQRAIRTASITLVEVLQGSDRPFALTPDQVMVVRDTARHGYALRDMVRGLRIVQRHWTGVLLDLAEREPPSAERAERVRRMLEVVSGFFDDTIDSVMVEYLDERQRLLSCSLRSRQEAVARILAGEDVEDASRVLGVDLDHHHLALAFAPVPAGREAGASAPGLIESLAGGLRADASLVVAGADGASWAWLSGPAPFAADHLVTVRAVLGRHGRATCGVGRPRPGRAGFCQGLSDARDALRIARLRPGDDHVVAFDEVRLAALLSTDVDRARSFVRDELGGLAADQPAMAELRSTLRTYFEADQSLVKAAARLYLHRNTVVYRLRRIEQLLGHPVSEHALEVHAALDLAATLGEAVLLA